MPAPAIAQCTRGNLPLPTQAVPSLAEILPLSSIGPPSIVIRDDNPPPRIAVKDHREAPQVPERHDEFPLLRGKIVHCGFRGWPRPSVRPQRQKRVCASPMAGSSPISRIFLGREDAHAPRETAS